MQLIRFLPNAAAMASSLVAIVILGMVTPKIGGQIGLMLKFISLGVFASVFMHAGFELAETFGLLSGDALLVVMGFLITLGSALFCTAGIIGLRALH